MSGYAIIRGARDNDPKRPFLSISRQRKENTIIGNLPLTILKTTAWSSPVRVKDQGTFAHRQWCIFLAGNIRNLFTWNVSTAAMPSQDQASGEHSKGYNSYFRFNSLKGGNEKGTNGKVLVEDYVCSTRLRMTLYCKTERQHVKYHE